MVLPFNNAVETDIEKFTVNRLKFCSALETALLKNKIHWISIYNFSKVKFNRFKKS